jgi:hypothetical protein
MQIQTRSRVVYAQHPRYIPTPAETNPSRRPVFRAPPPLGLTPAELREIVIEQLG